MNTTLTYVKEHGRFPEGFKSYESVNPVGSHTTQSPIAEETLATLRETIMDQIPLDDRPNTKFVILDGFILYVNEALRRTIDIKFFFTAPYQILKERRESRKGYDTMDGYWVDPPGYFDDIVWPNYLTYNSPFVKITDAMEAGKETGVYDASGSHRTDPMTQQVDVVSSAHSSIHTMVEEVANLLTKRLSELDSPSS
ncbi:ribosylnicotinamide kinase [Mortierella sp. GBA43]|nr:ribosylnicotinamide kinase [Mortierella sp. GBA43]